jgi:large subunit ribosomal protein L1
MKAIMEKVDREKSYSIDDALGLVKEVASAKFDESVDVAINLGVDARKSDQNVRGATVLPAGSGKTVKVAVFAEGENADKAKSAGADIVGFEDLAETIKGGTMDFDICIATPDAMRVVGQLGQILGPRGLMPNPKVGTVTADVAKAVQNAKAGQVQYRIDKAGIIHCSIGKASFEPSALKDNLYALMTALEKSKPSSAKGIYIKRLAVSTTMGPGIGVDVASLSYEEVFRLLARKTLGLSDSVFGGSVKDRRSFLLNRAELDRSI